MSDEAKVMELNVLETAYQIAEFKFWHLKPRILHFWILNIKTKFIKHHFDGVHQVHLGGSLELSACRVILDASLNILISPRTPRWHHLVFG